jgi:hypothetical protein
VSTRTIALHDGESGINVLCGRREHSSGGGLTLKKGIEYHERIERVSTCTIALHDGESAVQTSDVDGESTAAAAA